MMEQDQAGRRVQVFVKEGEHVHGKPVFMAILELLLAEGAAGATVTRAIAGFGAHSKIRSANLIDLATPLPLVITWVDTAEAVERLLPAVSDLVHEGLITVESVHIAKHAHRGAGGASGHGGQQRKPA